MAISTYAELQTAVGSNWLNRSDLTSRVPEFISLCESELDRRLRTTDQLKRATTTASDQFIALPSDFLEMRNIQLDTSPVKRLKFITPDHADDLRRRAYNSTAEPIYFTILGNSVELLPTPVTPPTLQISYYGRVSKLSDSNTANTILTNAPDIYLYGSLKHAEPFLMNDERVQLWGTLFERGIEELQRSEDKQQEYDGVMMMNPAVRLDYGAWR